ncbi:cerebellin-2-like [Ylistrum balloti]|uniref:cerebellin-2-like n=1 Tax=Ylistrum balloti TaxID=509963 RepID=UPI002905A7E3|nr:cerebellin-2-like [Ylistrum balloti]
MSTIITLFSVFVLLSPGLDAGLPGKKFVTVDPEKEEYGCIMARMDDKLDNLMARLAKLESRPDFPRGKEISFSAYLSDSNIGPRSSGSLKFTKVITNIGDAYNSATGVFTAPADGLYAFHFQASEYSYAKPCTVTLYHGNTTIVSNYGYDSNGYTSFGNTGVIEMKKSGVAHIGISAVFTTSNCYIRGKFTTFSGYLLK